MRSTLAWWGVLPLLAFAVWTPGCKSPKDKAPQEGSDVAPLVATVDEDAVAIVRRAAEFVRDSQSFRVSMEMGFDVVQENGQKLEFGATRTATIQRPNRARFEYERRDGKSGTLIFDGNDIWAYSRTHEVYARTSQPGGIDEAIDLITEDLGINVPMSDLFMTDAGARLADGLTDCYIVGEASVSGVRCDHVAIRNDYADYQMWIAADGDPLLRRVVITYREEEGEPQFWANLTEWNMAPNAASTTFLFQPPAGAEEILFNSINPQEEE